jgi:hypothetical protein
MLKVRGAPYWRLLDVREPRRMPRRATQEEGGRSRGATAKASLRGSGECPPVPEKPTFEGFGMLISRQLEATILP